MVEVLESLESLLQISSLVMADVGWRSNLSSWRLHVIIRRFNINSLLIDAMAPAFDIDSEESHLVFLGLVPVLELHFDEAEASASVGVSVSHDDGISNDSVLLEVLDQIRFYKEVKRVSCLRSTYLKFKKLNLQQIT